MAVIASFAGPLAKLKRAEDQIKLLRREAERFLGTPRTKVEVALDPHSGCRVLKVTRVPTPPLRLSVLIGEILFNLRSSLDHAVHQLIVANTGKEPVHRSYEFPIFKTEEKFAERLPRVLRDVSAPAIALIAEMQPFRMALPEHDALYVLNELHYVDKHRLLLLGTVRGRVSALSAKNRRGTLIWAGGGYNSEITAGTVLVQFDKTVSPRTKLAAVAQFDLGLKEDPSHQPAVDLLEKLAVAVRRTLKRLEPTLR